MSPSRIASIVYAITIGIFGINHFRYGKGMGGMVPNWFPGDATVWVYIAGAGLILAAISIIIGKYTRLACYLLAGMLLLFVFTLHLPSLLKGNETAITGVLKDTAMAMAAIIIGEKGK
jgi:uncharacterized membrane protein